MSHGDLIALGALAGGWSLMLLGCLLLARRLGRGHKDFEP
jgi:hypothetical protein